MGHGLPPMVGADMKRVDRRMSRVMPDYMTMGTTGMGGMGEMEMPIPPNSLPMRGGAGPVRLHRHGRHVHDPQGARESRRPPIRPAGTRTPAVASQVPPILPAPRRRHRARGEIGRRTEPVATGRRGDEDAGMKPSGLVVFLVSYVPDLGASVEVTRVRSPGGRAARRRRLRRARRARSARCARRRGRRDAAPAVRRDGNGGIPRPGRVLRRARASARAHGAYTGTAARLVGVGCAVASRR